MERALCPIGCGDDGLLGDPKHDERRVRAFGRARFGKDAIAKGACDLRSCVSGCDIRANDLLPGRNPVGRLYRTG